MTPVVASLALRPLLHGPEQPASVLASFDHAAYVRIDTGAAPTQPPTVLSLVTRDGVAHPNALILPTTAADRPLSALHRGTPGTVGAGRLCLAGQVYRPARWRSSEVCLPPVDAAALAAGVERARHHLDGRAAPLPDGLAAPLGELVEALLRDDSQAASDGADRLIGLGPGLTPAGDDVLSGLLAGLRSLAPAVTPPVTSLEERIDALAPRIAGRAVGRTTDVSVALLCHAAHGRLAAPAARLLAALVCTDAAAPRRIAVASDELLAVGSTSGRDLAVGMLAAGELVARAARRTAGRAASFAA